jgi:predicted peroxiredoxin
VKFVYLSMTGPSDATRASLPLHLAANGSLEVGHDVAIVFAGDAVEMIIGDNPQKVEGVGVPPARDLFAKLAEHRVPVYV